MLNILILKSLIIKPRRHHKVLFLQQYAKSLEVFFFSLKHKKYSINDDRSKMHQWQGLKFTSDCKNPFNNSLCNASIKYFQQTVTSTTQVFQVLKYHSHFQSSLSVFFSLYLCTTHWYSRYVCIIKGKK